jgi:hypothetical protein
VVLERRNAHQKEDLGLVRDADSCLYPAKSLAVSSCQRGISYNEEHNPEYRICLTQSEVRHESRVVLASSRIFLCELSSHFDNELFAGEGS